MKQINIAIFVSGSGSNCENLIRYFSTSATVRCALVVSNKADAGGLEKAQRLGVMTAVVPKTQLNDEPFMLALLRRHGIDFIVLAGFLPLVPDFLIDAFPRRIINLHPALLPSFPGAHGIADAFDHGVKVSGITVHFANADMDAGPIIAQRAVEIREDDTVDTFEERIHEAEHELYPQVLQLIAQGRVTVEGRKVRIS